MTDCGFYQDCANFVVPAIAFGVVFAIVWCLPLLFMGTRK